MTALTGVCLLSRDVPVLSRFYSRLLEAPLEGDDQFCVVHVPGAQLSIFDVRGMENMAPGSVDQAGTGSMTLEFRVADVDAIFDRLTCQEVQVVKPPTTQPWGRRSVWIRDPDGNIVNLYRPAEAHRPAEVAARYFRRLFEEHDLAACDEMLTPGYVDHDAPLGSPAGPVPTKAYVRRMLQKHQRLTVQVQSTTELGDHVALNVVWDGTLHDGSVHHESGLVLLQLDDSGRIRERASTYHSAHRAHSRDR